MGGGVGQEVLFKACWNWICLLLQLKSWTAGGASHDPAYSSGIDQGMRRGGGSKIFLLPQRFQGFPSNLPQAGVMVTLKWPSGKAIILLVKWMGGWELGAEECSNNFMWIFFCLPLRMSFLPWWEIERCQTFAYWPYTLINECWHLITVQFCWVAK